MDLKVLLLAALAVVVPTMAAKFPSYKIINVTCAKGSDCPRNYCCVQDPIDGNGMCKPMGKTASECHTSQDYAWSRPENMVTDYDRCPCQSGEICMPTADGRELGICSYG